MSENPKIGQFELNQAAAEMLLQSIKTVHGFLHSEEMSLSLSVDRVLGAAEGLLEQKRIESKAKVMLMESQARESDARARNLDIDTELMGREKTAHQMMVRVNALFQKVERMERQGGQPPVAPPAPAPQHTLSKAGPPRQHTLSKAGPPRQTGGSKQQPRPSFNPQLADALSKVSAPEMVGVDGHTHLADVGSEEELNGFAAPAAE